MIFMPRSCCFKVRYQTKTRSAIGFGLAQLSVILSELFNIAFSNRILAKRVPHGYYHFASGILIE